LVSCWYFLGAREIGAQTPYYQGKTIRVVVGYPAGSAHDLWARLIAPQLTKHIPGNPATVVQVMPGAGSMTATNYIYSVAKPDGLTLGVNNAALYFEQLLKKREVQFDWSKFAWVGGTTRTSPILYMWANTPYKTIHDVRTATVPPKCGVTGRRALRAQARRKRLYRPALRRAALSARNATPSLSPPCSRGR
jgi:tripartite-type tricarboxylate transporter receptor subunit TctC